MKRVTVLLAALCFATVAEAQVETIITTVTDHQGNEEVAVEYRQKMPDFSYDSFAAADLNGDGCLDKQEAHNQGILNFERYAKTTPRCLTEEEYTAAMEGRDPQ